MSRLVVLGGGTVGTMVVNKLRRKLDPASWQITVEVRAPAVERAESPSRRDLSSLARAANPEVG